MGSLPDVESFGKVVNKVTRKKQHGGARPGAGRKPTGMAMTSAERQELHRERFPQFKAPLSLDDPGIALAAEIDALINDPDFAPTFASRKDRPENDEDDEEAAQGQHDKPVRRSLAIPPQTVKAQRERERIAPRRVEGAPTGHSYGTGGRRRRRVAPREAQWASEIEMLSKLLLPQKAWSYDHPEWLSAKPMRAVAYVAALALSGIKRSKRDENQWEANWHRSDFQKMGSELIKMSEDFDRTELVKLILGMVNRAGLKVKDLSRHEDRTPS